MNYKERCYKAYTYKFYKLDAITEKDLDSMCKHFKRLIIDKFLPPDKSIKILDLGCGYGAFLYALQKEGYTNSFGIDININLIEIGRKVGVCNVECMDLLDFLRNEQNKELFDVVTAFDVIEHFTKDQILDILDNIYICLKPRGFFIMEVPNAECLGGLAIRYSGFTHEIAFTRESVCELFFTVGFRRIHFPPSEVFRNDPIRLTRLILQDIMAKIFGSDKWMFFRNLIAVGYKQK